MFGQNEWGNLAIGDDLVCPRTRIGCPPRPITKTFQNPTVVLGATWTHVLDAGKLFSAGWAGDGACGFSPAVKTRGMDGVTLNTLVDASQHWIQIPNNVSVPQFVNEIEYCSDPRNTFGSGSAAYSSSLMLSSDRRCVFTFGLLVYEPTCFYNIPKSYQDPTSTAASYPVPVFASDDENRVTQVLASWSRDILVMDDGSVLTNRKAGSHGCGGRHVKDSEGWEQFCGSTHSGVEGSCTLSGITRIATDRFEYFAAVGTFGTKLLTWGTPIGGELQPIITTEWPSPVVDVSLGLAHILVLRQDGTLWSQGSNTCGQLGRETAPERFEKIVSPDGGDRWAAVCAGAFFSLAIDGAGIPYIWGTLSGTDSYVPWQVKACTDIGKTHMIIPTRLMPDSNIRVSSIACGLYHGAVVVNLEHER